MAQDYPTIEEAQEQLAQLQRECMAFVAEHYIPWDESRPESEFEGSWSDEEFVWDRALDHVLGPMEWWVRYRTITVPSAEAVAFRRSWSEVEVARFSRVSAAWLAIVLTAMDEFTRQEHEARLFNGIVEQADPFSPQGMSFDVIADGASGKADMYGDVATYLLNVRDGLIHSTSAFHESEDEED